MSLDQAQLETVANRIFKDPVSDLINRESPFLQGLQKKAVAGDKIYLRAAVDSDHAAGAIVDGSDVTFDGSETTSFIRPELPWCTYISKFSMNKRAIAAVGNNEDALFDSMKYEIMMAAQDLGDQIANDLFLGNVANGLVGLRSMVNDGGTYAGILRNAANENWASAVFDNSPDGLVGGELSTQTFYNLDALYFEKNGYGFTDRGSQFTAITNAGVYQKYKGLMETIDFGSLSTAHFINQANASGQLGYNSSIGFAGMPIIRSRNVSIPGADLADTSRIYILDMSKIYLCQLSENAQAAAVHKAAGFMSAPDVKGLDVKINFLANTGESLKGYLSWYGQLCTPDPKKAGAMINNVLAV